MTAEVLPVHLPMVTGGCDAFMFDADGRPMPLRFGSDPKQGLAPFVAQIRALPPPEAKVS